ncbi:hypothetical protein [Crocinitomix algicola]|uniref:hypothetical protein n=1 Tax=Crocinitomix algicola TaxID=1740263 RepID=UPI000834103D|nr:hypothetical protein [Crocinitomix algicola]
MSGLIQTRLEIQRALNKEKFRRDTVAQINKDLNETGSLFIEIDKSDLVLDNLINELSIYIARLAASEKLSQFIYRVDLREDDYKENLISQNWTELAFLVIRREAQKVYMRNHFF